MMKWNEKLAYIGVCLMTFGGAWALKLVIQKAINDEKKGGV